MSRKHPDFAGVAARVTAGVSKAVYTAADMVRAEAHRSITAGSISGKGHKPSAPGSAPNNDTDFLRNNLSINRKTLLEAEVSSNAPYSVALEFGTSKMAARPFMRPARDKVAQQAGKLLAREINRARRGRK